MKKGDFDSLVEAVWLRVAQKLAGGSAATLPQPARGAYVRDGIADSETRYAVWMEAVREVRLTKSVDLREIALHYPLLVDEILNAVKLMTGGCRPLTVRGKGPGYTPANVEEAIVKMLGYSILAARDEIRDDKPKEAPCEKKYDYPGSWCHEKEDEKGDFVCRGGGKNKKDFTCGGKLFFCSRDKGRKESFICDASSKRDDTFQCTGNFRCEWNQGETFSCVAQKERQFQCTKKDKDFICRPSEPGKEKMFYCTPDDKGAGFQDKCVPKEDYACQAPKFEPCSKEFSQ